MKSILELSNVEVKALVLELKEILDENIGKKLSLVHKELSKEDSTIRIQDSLEFLILKNPIYWAFLYLNWEARDYQDRMLMSMSDDLQTVLRLGRRLGKTETMCVMILYHAYTQPNIGDNPEQYDVLIITPYESQVLLIFKRLGQLIEGSEFLASSLTRNVFLNYTLDNKSNITGMTAGSKGSSGAASTRGQRADLIIFDEVDYMGDEDITNIQNVRNEDPSRIKIIAASTPSGRRAKYYNWCVNATRSFEPSQEDINNYTFSGYILKENYENGNGWTHIYAPSTVNDKILEINPDTRQSFLEDLKVELSDIRFLQEVMALFGDQAQGVYRSVDIEWMMKESTRQSYEYIDKLAVEEASTVLDTNRYRPIILGVDWDKYGADTNFACVALDRENRDHMGRIRPMFKVLFRTVIERGQFTYVNAVNKIIELNNFFNFDWISIDRGYGETQIEMLVKHGMENPETGLHEKVVGYQFSEKIEMRDPFTGKKIKKDMKPFMVNNSSKLVERNKLIFEAKDSLLKSQFEDYHVVSIGNSGKPVYSSENEHILDCINLALLLFEQKYSTLFKRITSVSAINIEEIYRETTKIIDSRAKSSEIVSGALEHIYQNVQKDIKISAIGNKKHNNYVVKGTNRSKNALNSIKRSVF